MTHWRSRPSGDDRLPDARGTNSVHRSQPAMPNASAKALCTFRSASRAGVL